MQLLFLTDIIKVKVFKKVFNKVVKIITPRITSEKRQKIVQKILKIIISSYIHKCSKDQTEKLNIAWAGLKNK